MSRIGAGDFIIFVGYLLIRSVKDFDIVDYINVPPTPSELQSLAAKMGIRAKDFIHKNEAVFKELDLTPHMDNDEFLFQKMSENPKLIERPIVVKGDRAVLGRPPEKIKNII